MRFLLCLTSLNMIISRSTNVAANGVVSYSSWLSDIPLYICTILYPFLSQWTLRLLPCLGYCKHCCCEHWGARILLDPAFLWIYTQECDCRLGVERHIFALNLYLS